MSGTAKVKPAKNNAEWARNTQKRIDQVEHPTSTRVGSWVLSTQADTGNLIASHVDGGSVLLGVKPESAGAPDTVLGTDFTYIKLQRQQIQTESRGSAHLIDWDTVAHQSPGWGFIPPATDIVVPDDGTYLCILNMVFNDPNDTVGKAIFLIEAVPQMTQEFDPALPGWYQNMHLAGTFDMTAGDLVSAAAFQSGVGTFDVGPSQADPTVFTSLSLIRLPVG